MKYPIVLVHGILLKDVLHFKAFGKIEKMLKAQGYCVYTADHDGLGTIQSNAEQLRSFVNRVLEKEGAERVNMICHSKGGLDSLYMIDRLSMSKKIASVTFLCTPHKGSPIATRLYDMPKILRNSLALWLNFIYKILGDKRPNALEVCRSLKSTPEDILKCFDHHDGIYMQSFASELETSRDDFVMGIPLIFSRMHEDAPSDGMVSYHSSQYANFRGNCIEGSISHSQIVDFCVGKSKKEKIYSFYCELCKELEHLGY